MTSTVSDRDTFYGDAGSAERVFDLLASEFSGFYLVGREKDDHVELDEQIHQVLLRVVDAMRQGKAVTITPQSMTLTTQEAAEMLGVSRPTLVKLLDEGKIPFERPAKHRRLRLEDVLDYREARRSRQYSALETTAPAVEEPAEAVLDRMRRAKAEAGRRRRAGRV